jgi:predicted membrane protein
MAQRSYASCGFVLLLIGLLLLLATTGLIAIDFWGILIPLLMIAFGGLTLWMVATRRGEPHEMEVRVPLEGATSARVKIRFGAGRLMLTSGSEGQDLGRVQAFGEVRARGTTVAEGRLAEFWVPTEFLGDILAPWKWSERRPPTWNMTLREAIPLDLDVEAGACQMDLDLTSLQVRELRLVTGASSVDVRMPKAAGETRARLTVGAAGVKVHIPDGVAARVRVPTSLGEVEVNRSRFPGSNGMFESKDFASAAHKVDVSIEVGAASVEIS